MVMTKRIFGMSVKILAIKKGHHILNRWLLRDSHKMKPRRGPLLAMSDGGLFTPVYRDAFNEPSMASIVPQLNH
jgi:hypothetical protein